MDSKDRIDKGISILSKNISKLKVDEKDKSITFGSPVQDIWITLRETSVWTPAVIKQKIFWGITLWEDEITPAKKELKGSLYVNIDDYSFSEYIDYKQFENIFNSAKRFKERSFDAKLNKYSKDNG